MKLSYNPAIPFLDIYSKQPNTNSKRYMHPSVHSSIIYKPRHGSNRNAHQQMNRERGCGISIYLYICIYIHTHTQWNAAAAAAKSLQSCPTLCATP